VSDPTPTPRPVVVSLPIEDRPRSYRFYQDVLGLRAVGELADDGVPEPLQFVLGPGVTLMLIPTGGFGWVVGRELAPSGQAEVLLSLSVATPAEVDDLAAAAAAAGATLVTPPTAQPWGYSTVFADPDQHTWMVTVDPSGAA
jgi:predicted lactoylglutathione lyase